MEEWVTLHISSSWLLADRDSSSGILNVPKRVRYLNHSYSSSALNRFKSVVPSAHGLSLYSLLPTGLHETQFLKRFRKEGRSGPVVCVALLVQRIPAVLLEVAP